MFIVTTHFPSGSSVLSSTFTCASDELRMHWFNMDTSQRAWSRVTDANGQVHRLDGDMDSIPDATKIIHALRAIIACYGVGTRDKAKLLENLGHYILEAKTILDGIEGHDPRWWTAHLPPFDTL